MMDEPDTSPPATVPDTAEGDQLKTIFAAHVVSLGAVILVTLVSKRVPALRRRLSASRWRMRVAMMAFMAAYNLIERRRAHGRLH